MSSTHTNPRSAASHMAKIAAFVAAAFMVLVLAGCAAPQAANNTEGEEAAMTSSQYMAEVNQTVGELKERLQSFNEAVSRQDPITMRTQADNAFAVLDQLAAIEAPEDVKDLRDEYVKGCDQLKEALNSYISLYTEISSAKAQASNSSNNYYGNSGGSNRSNFDVNDYADQIEQIQKQYDEGIKTLEDADNAAKDR